MKNIKINLAEQPISGAKTAILVLPGGGYSLVSELEGGCIANKFNALGYSSFVLKYSVAPHRFPTALLQVATAIKYIRGAYPDIKNVVLCGFSAGGHLAASMATLYASPVVTSAVSGCNLRPDAAILCYPVITFQKQFCHIGSFRCLCGNFHKKLMESLSLENLVTEDTPPMFLWHTKEDKGVPCENSILMAEALEAKHIPNKLVLFPHGGHGLSLASAESKNAPNLCYDDVATWPTLARDWLNSILK